MLAGGGDTGTKFPLHKKKKVSQLVVSLCACGTSLLLRRFVFRMAEARAKEVTGDEPQGTMGRVQTKGERLPFCQILCDFLGKKVIFLAWPNFWSF